MSLACLFARSARFLFRVGSANPPRHLQRSASLLFPSLRPSATAKHRAAWDPSWPQARWTRYPIWLPAGLGQAMNCSIAQFLLIPDQPPASHLPNHWVPVGPQTPREAMFVGGGIVVPPPPHLLSSCPSLCVSLSPSRGDHSDNFDL